MLFQWLKPKKNPEKDLGVLQKTLQGVLGPHLKSMLVFGSMAGDDFHHDRSDVNVLIAVADLTAETLQTMGPAFTTWLKKGHTMPVLVETGGVDVFAQDFPIEFLDMQDQHTLLWGEDPLGRLHVDKKHLKAQCEHDLALAQLRLRQAVAVTQGQHQPLLRALEASLPSVLTLFRAAIRLEESAPKSDKIQAVEQLAAKLGFDPAAVRRLKDLKFQRGTDNVVDLAGRYLDAITAVLNDLRK